MTLAWAALAEMFGPPFLDSYGDEAPRLWRVAIDGLSDQQLRRGFEALLEQARRFPPNLSEFVSACRSSAPVRFLGVPESAEERARRLEVLPASAETRDFHLTNIKARLGML